MTLRGIAVRPGKASVQWLFGRIRGAQKDDPLHPVTVIVPNHYVGLWLRRELAQEGYANVRFEILARLAERLGSVRLARSGLRPLTAVAEDALIRRSVRAIGEGFGAVAEHPALVDTLRELFGRLREREVSSADLDSWVARGRMARASFAAYRQYEELLGSHLFYDDRAGVDAATDEIRIGGLSTRDLGDVLVYLPTVLPLTAARLIRAIGELATVEVAIADTGDPLADKERTLICSDLRLGDVAHASSEVPAALRQVIVAPTADEEIRAVCRLILADLDAGIPLNRIGVLWRSRAPYAVLVPEVLRSAGLPFAALEGRPLSESFVAQGLLRLLALADADFARLAVLEWRSTLPPAGYTEPSFAEWNRLSRSARVVRGPAQWKERLERLAEEHRLAASEDGISEGQQRFRQREAATAAAIASELSGVADAVRPPTEQTWSAYVAWAKALRRRFVPPHAEDDERQAADLVDDVIDGLGGAAIIDGTVELPVFRRALEAALEGQRRPNGQIGVGVVIGQVAAARGVAFDRVHIVGMAEGAFPSKAPPDPVFPEGDPPGVSADRLVEERSAFRAAAASAAADGGTLRLSAPAWDSELRPLYAAPWLLEIASDLEGRRVSAAQLRNMTSHGPFFRVRSPDEGLANGPVHLELAERRVAEARTASMRGSLEHAAVARRVDLPLSRIIHVQRARNSPALTEFDGNVEAVATSSARLRGGLTRTAVSPSALEQWALCPFRYFLDRVLFVEETSQPEDDEAWSIIPAVKGSLIHRILQRFFQDLATSGRPGRNETYTPQDHARLDRIAAEEFALIEARGRSGYALAWENERASILRDLHTLLLKDQEMRASGGWVPLRFEQAFGPAGEWPAGAISAPSGAEVRFRGRLDRVDVAPDRERPERARLFDYKTGRVDRKALEADPLVAGTQLQLAVYGRVVKEQLRALGVAEPLVEAAYWQVVSRYKFEMTDVAITPELEQRLAEVVEIIHRGVAAGAFPQVPGEESMRPGVFGWDNCVYCEYDRICPSARDQLAARKSSDPARGLHRALQVAP